MDQITVIKICLIILSISSMAAGIGIILQAIWYRELSRQQEVLLQQLKELRHQ